jgi:hypothetical protein
MVDDPSQNAKSQDSPPPRPLSPWNPLDHLRLLWWVLVTPQQLKAYRAAFGENAERRVGKWLASTLAWLPLFVLTLAMGLGTLPGAETGRLRTADLWTSVGLVLAWMLTGRLGKDSGCLAGLMLLITAMLSTMFAVSARVLAFDTAVVDVVAFNAVGGIKVVLAMGLLFGLAAVAAIIIVAVVVGDAAHYMAIVAAGYVAMHIVIGRLTFFVAFLLALPTAYFLVNVVKKSLKTGHLSWFARGAFGALMLAYTFLIWFSFLGGWQVFQ